jgi:hypothetical protein
MIIFDKLSPKTPNEGSDHEGDFRVSSIQRNIATTAHFGLLEVLTTDNAGKIGDPNTTVCIVSPGPSARAPEVLSYLNAGHDDKGKEMLIVLASAGYGMLGRGLTKAHAWVAHHSNNTYASPNEQGQMVETIPGLGDRKDIQYLVSSMSPTGVDPDKPSLFDLLAQKGITPQIWHAHIEGVTDFGDDKVSVGTGSGAPVAAMALFAAMGYRKFEFFGMDGSSAYDIDVNDTPTTQKYLQGLKDQEMAVSVGGKVFTVTRAFWPQTLEVMDFLKNYPEAVQSIKFSGNTANAAIFNSWNGREFTCGEIKILEKPKPGADGIADPAP